MQLMLAAKLIVTCLAYHCFSNFVWWRHVWWNIHSLMVFTPLLSEDNCVTSSRFMWINIVFCPCYLLDSVIWNVCFLYFKFKLQILSNVRLFYFVCYILYTKGKNFDGSILTSINLNKIHQSYNDTTTCCTVVLVNFILNNTIGHWNKSKSSRTLSWKRGPLKS